MLAAQSCLTLCNPVDCSPPGFSAHGILQARILEWVAISFSRDLLNPGIEPGSPELQADSLPSEPQGKPHFFFFIWIRKKNSTGSHYQKWLNWKTCPRPLDLKLEYLLKAKQTNNKKLRNLQEMDFLHLIHFNYCICNFSHWVIRMLKYYLIMFIQFKRE